MKSNEDKHLLKISEIAKKSGVLPSTIRYYTDIGLIKVKGTTEGGQRLYSEEEVISILRKIKWFSQKGYSINKIKEILKEEVKTKKLLVVDDDQSIYDLISDLNKQKLNCELKIAYDGFQAGRILSEFLPDLVILDLFLPGVNGFEICRQIKKDNFLKDTKILAITGYDSPEHRNEILNAGADDYLAKPMDISVLYNKIKKLLG